MAQDYLKELMKKARQAKEDKPVKQENIEEKVEVKKAEIDKALELLQKNVEKKEEKPFRRTEPIFEKKSYSKIEPKEEVKIIKKEAEKLPSTAPEIQETPVLETQVDKEYKEAKRKEIIDQYGEITIYKIQDKAMPYYTVPSPRPTESEKAVINTIKEVATRVISINPYFIRDPEQRRVVYKEKILEILGNAPELKIPKSRFDFYADAVVREMVGFGLIDQLVRDDGLEEIMVIGAHKPVYVFHRKYEMMKTNVEFISDDEIDDLINRMGREIGRRVDFSNPLLDARLPDGSRVNATISPASVSGSTITIRKFRKDPYSIVDLVKFNTLSSEAAAFLWVCTEGLKVKPANILISGGTGSGKTTLLNVLASLIPSPERIITIEDSVTADTEIIILEDGCIKKTKIGDLVDSRIKNNRTSIKDSGHEVVKNNKNVEALCFDLEGKIIRSKVGEFIRHKTNKQIYEIILTSGRKIKVTEDHSLFYLDQNGQISPIKTSELKEWDYIATPRILPLDSIPLNYFDCWDKLAEMKNVMVTGKIISNNLKECTNEELFRYTNGKSRESKRNILNIWRRNSCLPIKIFNKMVEDGLFHKKHSLGLSFKNIRNQKNIPLNIPITDNFLKLCGLWLADGCYDKNSIIITAEEKELQQITMQTAYEFGLSTSKHSDGFSLMLNSSMLKQIMQNAMELKGNSFTKKIPSWIHNLSNNQICAFLSGYFSGDGTSGKHEIEWTSCSEQIMSEMQTLLLRLGIFSRISTNKDENDQSMKGRISGYSNILLFLNKIGFIPKEKHDKAQKIILNGPATHDKTDIIPLRPTLLNQNRINYCYRSGKSNIGRRYLQTLLTEGCLTDLKKLGLNDIFWDQIKETKKIDNENEYVYDLSIPGYENFICNNIFVHNTAELNLPLDHWVRLESRPPGLEGRGELTLDILTKNSLRMRPDRIIVGEIRHDEAFSLFTAMNTGHAGSLGTVHANSAKETIVRVTSPPMNVPKMMLSGLDLIIVEQRIHDKKLGTIRRLIEISEVSGVLVDRIDTPPLFEWDAKTDYLERTSIPSNFLKELEKYSGLNQKQILDEIEERKKFIEMLIKRDIREIGKVKNEMETFLSRGR
ncbi:MAG: hypothetical protein COT15_00485 [Candidatus Diapherotrites archaeon CG08_land_8_20_14_0_20_34_12]|nr:MAG: hypothetical protein COT15_00485 [Candidatus Diapherotrites archaeon CG08_land_8_20_14_0_20_34_12]